MEEIHVAKCEDNGKELLFMFAYQGISYYYWATAGVIRTYLRLVLKYEILEAISVVRLVRDSPLSHRPLLWINQKDWKVDENNAALEMLSKIN